MSKQVRCYHCNTPATRHPYTVDLSCEKCKCDLDSTGMPIREEEEEPTKAVAKPIEVDKDVDYSQLYDVDKQEFIYTYLARIGKHFEDLNPNRIPAKNDSNHTITLSGAAGGGGGSGITLVLVPEKDYLISQSGYMIAFEEYLQNLEDGEFPWTK